MALKAMLQQTDYEKLDAGLRTAYIKKDDHYVLDVEGGLVDADELRGQVTEFRDNNRALNRKVTELESKLKTYDGLDPAKYTEMQSTIKKLESQGVRGADDFASVTQKAIDAAVAPLMKQLSDVQSEAKQQKIDLAKADFTSKFKDEAIKAGVEESMLPHFIDYALKTYLYEDGQFVPKNGDTPLFSKANPAKHLDPKEWIAEKATTERGFFKPSSGGGAGGGTKPAGGARNVISNDPMEFGKHLEQIAKGEVTVSQS